MYLELGLQSENSLNPALHSSLALYLDNQPVEACEDAFKNLRKRSDASSQPPTADDWLFLGTLAQIIGLSARCRASYKLGWKAFPNDARLAALYAWELSARNQNQRCKRVLKSGLENCPDQASILHAVSCYNHSINRWNKTAIKAHEAALNAAGDDPAVLYVLSRAAGRRTDWELALELGQKVVSAQPNWSRAKAALYDTLMCMGKTEEAESLLDSRNSGIRHVWSDLCGVTFQESTSQFDQAIEQLESLVNYYPTRTKTGQFLVRQLMLLLLKKDRTSEAKELVQRHKIKGFGEWEKQFSDDPRKSYVSIPMIAQTQDHCVPTVAAMAANALGFGTTPNKLAELMETRSGTSIWKMVDVMKQLDFRVVCVKPEVSIIENILEQGAPLIGELSGVFSGHVDAVCGFDAGLKLFHLRDPMHWYGFSLPYETIEKRYKASCSLWVMIPPDRKESFEIKPEWVNREAEALTRMAQAIAIGDRTTAEQEFTQIGDEHPLSFMRDTAARNVVLTASQTEERLKKEVETISPDADLTLPQIRSMLGVIDNENASHIYQLACANRKRLGINWVKYVKAQSLIAKMQWTATEKILTDLSRVWPSMESLWSQLAMVKEELGKSKEADRCLQIALEITPEREHFQTREIERMKLRIPFEEQLRRHKAVEERFRYSSELKFSRAQLMKDSPNGLEYEQALRECIRFLPRNTWAYEQLSDWYSIQGRNDLAAETLASGRELIGEADMPISDWESKYWDSNKEETASETPTVDAPKQPDSADDKEDKNAANDPPAPSSEPAQTKPLAGATESAALKDEFQKCYAVVYEKANELDFEAFQNLNELKKLKEAIAAHNVTWHQSAFVLSLQIQNILADNSATMIANPDKRVKALKSILPKSVLGIPETFADFLLEQLLLDSAPNRLIQAIYDWVHEIAPNSKKYPSLVFQKAHLLELVSKLNDSEKMLEKLVVDHPAYVAGWYRIGQMQIQRSEYGEAWKTFEKCLSIQPGHYGSMSDLVRLAAHANSSTHGMQYNDALSRRLPYSNSQLYDSMFARVKEDKDCQEAVTFAEQHRQRIGESAYAFLVGRLYADNEKYEAAIKVVENTETNKLDRYSTDWVRIDSLVRLERFEEVETILAGLETDYPGDESIIDQRARLLRVGSLEVAAKYAAEKIKEGVALSILTYIDLTFNKGLDKRAIKMLDMVEPEHAPQIAVAYYQGVVEFQDSPATLRFLQHCRKKLPHVRSLRKNLVYALGTNGNIKESIKVARELYNEEPENPLWISTLGWAIQDEDAKESIRLLKEEYAITDSVETLAQMARGYQLLGDSDLAIKTYREVLNRNPNDTITLTNLMYKYKQLDKEMLNRVIDTIKKMMVNPSDQYFLVQAVKIAIKHRAQLPAEWYLLAIERWEQMKVETPFGDESDLLPKAIAAWRSSWEIPNADPKVSFVVRMKAKFFWPKLAWIPPKQT